MNTVNTKRKDGWQKPEAPVRRKLHAFLLDNVAREEVNWLWYPYIPAGKLTMLEGDPGVGKSWLTCKLAADISAGRMLPGQMQSLPPQKVLMLSAEDGLGDTVRPRIEALGGDLLNIYVSDDYFILDQIGLRELEDLMRQVSATIVFLDPLVAYLGGKMDMNKANEARAMMGPLAEAAKRTGSAIVAVRHLRKARGDNAKYSGLGSIDFTAAVRSTMQVQETKSGQKIIRHVKSNLAKEGNPLAYTFGDDKFEWQGVWEGDEDDIKVSTRSKLVEQGEAFLLEHLKYGPQIASETQEAALLQGISQSALQRSKKALKLVVRKTRANWTWALPGVEEPRPSVLPKADTLPDNMQKLLSEARARLEAAKGVQLAP